jgi:four helix bundle protein
MVHGLGSMVEGLSGRELMVAWSRVDSRGSRVDGRLVEGWSVRSKSMWCDGSRSDQRPDTPWTIDPRPWPIDQPIGMPLAPSSGVKAKNIDDVVVYKEALAAEDEVSAILDRSSSRVGPLIAEGFGQLTDRHLATYLARARGSAAETRTHLRKACRKKFISDAEHDDSSGKYTTIGKRLTRWIHYLEESDWDNRG